MKKKIEEILNCLHDASVVAGCRINLSYIEEEDAIVLIDCDLNHFELNIAGKELGEIFIDLISIGQRL